MAEGFNLAVSFFDGTAGLSSYTAHFSGHMADPTSRATGGCGRMAGRSSRAYESTSRTAKSSSRTVFDPKTAKIAGNRTFTIITLNQ
jgi:hypothetical protein